ncbi:hypothetical protein GTX14_11560 [Streptomyces sp. SID4944]|nr:hypothetical protein [Streptomyces sp. SID4944]
MRPLTYDVHFREQSTRIRNWGTGLLILTALLWGWCGIQLLTSHSVEQDLPEVLTVLWLSVAMGLVGTALFTTGAASRRMSEHAQAMRQLEELEQESGERRAS